jgi:prolyl oligopeptidase
MNAPINYPQSKRLDLVEELHGVKVADPYRWLEDSDSEDTQAWIKAQNEVTSAFLKQLPHREDIQNRLTELMNYERFSLPSHRGKRYFFTKNDGLQNQAVLYVTEGLDAEPQVLLDPNGLSEDGTVALSGVSVTDDGKLMAYSTSSGGSDWQEWFVRDIDAGKDLEDRIEWSKFSGASWTPDNAGFYYSAYDAPEAGQALQKKNEFQKLYFHRLGTPQSEDTLVYERKDQPNWGFGGQVTEDGRYLIIHVWHGTERENRVFYIDRQDPQQKVVELLEKADAGYSFLGNVGTKFYFQTDKDAPMEKVIAIDVTQPQTIQTILPEASSVLQGMSLVGGKMIAVYLKDAQSSVSIFDLDGRHEKDLALPGIGTAGGFGGRLDEFETFYTFTSFTCPATIYRYDLKTGETTLYKRPTVEFNPDAYVTKQVFFTSKDGTRVPMFLTHSKDAPIDGNRPTVLGGYGGFAISITPGFNPMDIPLLERGGILAVACLRGGGEYGKAWHDGGRLKNKQNVFDDFIGAAEYLIDNGYTNKTKLAIRGGSNGGLLVGACLVQRPDLYAACVPYVGVLDMLRFHKFTIGWGWISDYGSPDEAEFFEVLLKYSPYHNVKDGTAYPPTLIVTGDHDDRVVPLHSFKFASALQRAQTGDAPILIRIETRAGHGAGKPLAMAIEEMADVYAFLMKNLSFN